ncbi:MAG TPA: hypothetical protein PK819_13105 [Thermomicrobiales bacterium]|nr:hypothetical protein [Thermomicrobiales bacterium]
MQSGTCSQSLPARSSPAPAILVPAIKALHTVIFLSLLVCLGDVVQALFRDRFTHRSKVSLAAIAVEGAVFFGNGRKCPLTQAVESLGAEKGQVSDIFLPDVVARNIFSISIASLGSGALVWVGRKWRRSSRA